MLRVKSAEHYGQSEFFDRASRIDDLIVKTTAAGVRVTALTPTMGTQGKKCDHTENGAP